ncbi:hypothetical protein FB45DRAFT_841722 [Roridomyces roridus]|uniref:LysM domain-containing protein n=1 Tax=Roridomyces roridus TaxID=1738132 RepID=A0AAD7BBK7_9AGAR|nr:hypothetical protein FB45DRAFT_841722 [Roridomyces roridus]
MFFSNTLIALFASAVAVSATPLLEARQSCTSSYTVVSGDYCALISTKTGVSVATIESLNPSINSGCTNLQIGQVLCLATGGSGSSGGSCGNTYTVVSGDTCSALESRLGVSDSTIHSLNPSINSGCTNLQIGQVLCIGSASSSSGGSGSSSGSINGIATYYDPDGGFGACGSVLTNDMFVVALNAGDYASGAHCGRSISVQYQGRSVNAVVQDYCPGCQGDHGIDLTEPAISVIDPNYVFDGHIAVTWNFI